VVVRGGGFDEFVVEVARSVVAKLAPDESPLVDVVGQAYLRDPKKVLDQGGRRAPGLGSGIDTVVAMLTPVALAVGASVYQHLVDKAGGAVVDGGGKLLRKVFRRDRAEADVVWRLVKARAVELGRSEAEAERIADALIAELDERDE
jgi:hypothetical protein